MNGPAYRFGDGDEEIVGLLVKRREGLEEDAAVCARPQRPVHVIWLELELGEVPLLHLVIP